MFEGYVNYHRHLHPNPWSCHIEYMGQEIECKRFPSKTSMQEYINSNSHVRWYTSEEIGKMTY